MIKPKKLSLLFRMQRWINFILRGIGKKETEHFLFKLKILMEDWELYMVLANYGWTPNYMGYSYRGQLYQCRRLADHGLHQYHVRLYDDGTVTGHYEVAPEWSEKDHLGGTDLRTMDKVEADVLRANIGGSKCVIDSA